MTMRVELPTASEALPLVLKALLQHGAEVGSRNGRVKEFLNAQIVITDPVRREVLSLNRKANVFAQIAETLWVLSGRNDIEWLSAYLPRAVDYSDDGETWRAGYGPRMRAWPGRNFSNTHDQLAYVVETLQADPLSRQAVIAIWDPVVDTAPGKDKACNTFLQFQSRGGALYLTVNVRSNDVMWGWSGINAFEWSTLQEMVASLLGIRVGTLTFNIGSLHLYEQHWQKARRVEYEKIDHRAIPFDPRRTIQTVKDLDQLLDNWFGWEEMCREGLAIPPGLEMFQEPLIKSWAAAIAYYWQREDHWLEPLSGTALAVAIARTPSSVLPEPLQTSRSGAVGQGHNLAAHERTRAFYEYVAKLHAVKHASYGDSWKKRGEKMSILANIARKVDRLGVGDEFDSSADTVIDLLVYAIKYDCWLVGKAADPGNVNILLGHWLGMTEEVSTEGQALDITFSDVLTDFDHYADNIDNLDLGQKMAFVRGLIESLAPLARDLWHREKQNGQIDQIHGQGAAAALEAAYKDSTLFSDDYRGADQD